MTALSYVGATRYPLKDDCFYTYACAQLSGFKWTVAYAQESGFKYSIGPVRTDAIRILYRARLLVPESNLENDEGLWHRQYDRGLVVVNPHQDMTRRVWLALPEAIKEPVDLYTGQLLKSENCRTYVSIPPQSGRVVAARSDAIRNFLAECAAFLNDIAREMVRTSDAELKQIQLRKDVDGAKAARLARYFGHFLQSNEVPGKETTTLLVELVAWCDSVPTGDHKLLELFRAAGEYAAFAMHLMDDVERKGH